MFDGSQPLGTNAPDKSRLADLLAKASPTIYSASPAQQRLWFLQQLQQGSSAYNVHLGLWLRGALDLAALQSSIRELVNRHDSLRTCFRLERDTLQQVVEGILCYQNPDHRSNECPRSDCRGLPIGSP